MTVPRFHIYTEHGEIWDGTAATATLLGDSEIRLRDNVVIVDEAGTTRLTTEQLNYFPKQQKVDSAVAVLLKRATDTSKSVGMRADLNTNHVELLSRVEGIHVP
jgi:lipopolysaccharide export system protein LptC